MAGMTISYVGAPYLWAVAGEPVIRRLKQRAYELMGLASGVRALDVGCGPGIDTIPMARVVGPNGGVVGVDQDPYMIHRADQEAVRAGVRGWTSHRQAAATALPFPDGSFDASHSERLLQHLPAAQPALALAEIARVTRPAGRIVVADTDWGTLSIDADDVQLERRIVRIHAEQFRNGYAGRRLFRMFVRQGMREVTVEEWVHRLDYPALQFLLAATEQVALASGAVSPAELFRWRTDLAQAAASGTFFAQLVIVQVAGRKV
jgi:ubiquinone/menaquinone biosynthesis C-methylase UbiE